MIGQMSLGVSGNGQVL